MRLSLQVYELFFCVYLTPQRRPLNIHHELSEKGNQATVALGLEPAGPPLPSCIGTYLS